MTGLSIVMLLAAVSVALMAVRVVNRSHSYSVDLGAWLFSGLSWLSLFKSGRWVLGKTGTSFQDRDSFIDSWVIGHLILSGLSVCALALDDRLMTWLPWYGVARLFELAVYQLNVLVFDRYQHDLRYTARPPLEAEPYRVASRRRLFVSAISNYSEAVLWFAAFHLKWGLLSEAIGPARDRIFDAVLLSGLRLALMDADALFPVASLGSGFSARRLLLGIEPLYGLLLIVVVFAYTISWLDVPPSNESRLEDGRKWRPRRD